MHFESNFCDKYSGVFETARHVLVKNNGASSLMMLWGNTWLIYSVSMMTKWRDLHGFRIPIKI